MRRVEAVCRSLVVAVIPEGRAGQREQVGPVAGSAQVDYAVFQAGFVYIGCQAQRVGRHLHGECYPVEVYLFEVQYPVYGCRGGVGLGGRVVQQQGDRRIRQVDRIKGDLLFCQVDTVGLGI